MCAYICVHLQYMYTCIITSLTSSGEGPGEESGEGSGDEGGGRSGTFRRCAQKYMHM